MPDAVFPFPYRPRARCYSNRSQQKYSFLLDLDNIFDSILLFLDNKSYDFFSCLRLLGSWLLVSATLTIPPRQKTMTPANAGRTKFMISEGIPTMSFFVLKCQAIAIHRPEQESGKAARQGKPRQSQGKTRQSLNWSLGIGLREPKWIRNI